MYKMDIFKLLAKLQSKYYLEIIGIFLIITIFLGYHGLNLSFESDITNDFPKNYDVFAYSDFVEDNFAGSQAVLVNIKIDRNINDNPIDNILDKDVFQASYRLDGFLREEENIVDIQSLVLPFKYTKIYPLSSSIINQVVDKSGSVKDIFLSDDKNAMLMIIYPKKLHGKSQIDDFVKLVEHKIAKSNFPYGIDVQITGSPVLRSDLTTYLEEDFIFTVCAALIGIFTLLYLVLKKLSKAIIVMLPLILGVIWYAGIVVLLDLKLSISTVATGAMILGLGVEYSIFIYTKFNHKFEEFKDMEFEKRVLKSITESVGTTGKAIFGSAMTTIVAFLALGLSEIPMIQKLGYVSTIGIFSVLILSIVFNPCIFVLIEKYKNYVIEKAQRGEC